jgi:hypothetical protein
MNVIVEIFFIFLQAVTTAFQIQVKDYDTYKHHLQEFELCHVFKMYFPNVEFIHYSRKQCLLTYQDDFVYLYLMFFGAQKSGKIFFVTNQNFAWNLLKIIQKYYKIKFVSRRQFIPVGIINYCQQNYGWFFFTI